MTKSVLLARPHPFIVSEMKPFLEDGGFSAAKLESMADLATQVKNSVGVVFAAMLDFDTGKRNLARRAIASRMIQRHFR